MDNTKFISMIAAAAVTAAPLAALAADDVTVKLDGSALEFDVPAQIIEGRTMVPLRAIFEALGAAVDWDGSTQTVTSVKDDITIKMTIGENVIFVNDDAKELDVAPLIINERTLVPARAVAEGFGANVDWDGDTRTVIIASSPSDSGEPPAKPDVEAAKPTAAPAKNADDIVIDTSSDLNTESVNSFKIEKITKNSDGDYEITYSFYTFLEGAGSVFAVFNCLDENEKVIDSFGGSFKTIDYTQTPQKGEAVISGKTVKIVLNK